MDAINYSQSTEQNCILNFFKDTIGTFADFGSNDGITLSNTYALAQLGWQGLLCEPSKEAFARLQYNYEKNMNVCLFNCAVTGLYEGIIKMYESGEHLGQGDISLLSTIHQTELKRWEGSQNTFTKVDVKAMPVNMILENSGFENIDFFSIDIEGSELEVIKYIDFDRYKTKMICVEFNGNNEELYHRIITPFGFDLIHKNAENLIYTKRKDYKS